MSTGSEMNEYISHAAKTMEHVYHAATRDGTIPAIAREAIHDVRNTINEVFFGKGERGGQPGTPLQPLFHDIVQDRNAHAAAMEQARPGTAMPVEACDCTEDGVMRETLVKAAEYVVEDLIGVKGQPTGQHEPPAATPGQIIAEEHRGSVHGPQQQGTVQGGIYGYGVEQGRETYGPPSALPANPGLTTPGEIIRDDERGSVHGQDKDGHILTQEGPTPHQHQHQHRHQHPYRHQHHPYRAAMSSVSNCGTKPNKTATRAPVDISVPSNGHWPMSNGSGRRIGEVGDSEAYAPHTP